MSLYSLLSASKTFDVGSIPKKYRHLELIVDTREQDPLWIPPVCKKRGLLVGDYTTTKLKNRFIIERKSPGDLYGSITKGHPRFKREILRAIEHKITLAVYVECTSTRFFNKKFPGGSERQYPGTGLERIIKTLQLRYKLEFIWCKDRNDMRKKILKRLNNETNKAKRIKRK